MQGYLKGDNTFDSFAWNSLRATQPNKKHFYNTTTPILYSYIYGTMVQFLVVVISYATLEPPKNLTYHAFNKIKVGLS